MKRILRRAFMILALLSMAICMAICVSWIRSYYQYNFFCRHGRVLIIAVEPFDDVYHWRTRDFVVADEWDEFEFAATKQSRFWGIEFCPPTPNIFGSYQTYATGVGPTTTNLSLNVWLLAIPCWMPAAFTAIAPLVGTVLFFRRCRRQSKGRCIACGYDLRATLDRCPECM